jgi:predicted nucleic acid-binding protein
MESSLRLIEMVKRGNISGRISALSVPILWFLTEKNLSESEAKMVTKSIIKGFSIITLNPEILNKSFKSEMSDFEDAIQLNSAIKGKCKYLITRNKKDFAATGRISILTPEEFLSIHSPLFLERNCRAA